MRNYGHTHKALVIGAALAFALSGTALCPTTALAVTQETEAQLTETQKKLEDSAAAYDKATENVAKLQAQIDENNALIAELEAKLPEQQLKASQVMRDMYKYEKASNPFMSFILNSQSFDEFFTQMAYMNQIKDSNTSALEELNETQKQLEQTKVELEQAKAQADTEAKAASDALAEAQKLREAAQKKADEEAASELAALQQASSELAGGTEESSSVVLPDTSGVNWNTDEASFVAEWSARIDAYLAGSPLEGYGATFAAAAWKYGVDPRWSPAISNTESSKGAYCFREHNAWGWGAIDFSSWEEAIDTHVRGLARGYGYTISVQAAKKYCPPNWYHWYHNTLSEMQKI